MPGLPIMNMMLLRSQKDVASMKHAEPRKALRSFLQSWLPLSKAVLDMVADQLPDPKEAAAEKIKALLPPEHFEAQIAQMPPHVQKVA